jgi:hypothetical protein
MLFNIFKPGVVPHYGHWCTDFSKSNFSAISNEIMTHAEVARPEYNYMWNSDGVRSVEFETKPRVIALGCSITLGQGLPVEFRWSDLLSEKIQEPIGNISYSGGSISQIVSSFIGMVKKYNYVPEYVIANFAPFERFHFISGDGSRMRDYALGNRPRKTKDSAPWDYGATIPYEWVYYNNLNFLQILESFCQTSGIKLIWSTWTNSLSESQEQFLMDNFSCYIQDPVRKEFPPHFEFHIDPKEVSGLLPFYKMKNWDSIKCHEEYFIKYPDIFDYAYDYHKIGEVPDRKITRTPHPGLHRQLHYAEFYYNKMLENGFTLETCSSTS